MFNVSPLCMQSIRMFLKNIDGVEFFIQALSKQYVELQRVVTPKELNPCPYFLLQMYTLSISICMQSLMNDNL